LRSENASWQTFKEAFRRRYKDIHTDQFHFTRLQSARQGKKDSPQEFADRCRALAQKLIMTADNPTAQRVHRENAERMLLASFVSGLAETPGRQVRYANPQTMQEALKIALSVQKAEKQERFNEAFIPNSKTPHAYHLERPVQNERETRTSGIPLTQAQVVVSGTCREVGQARQQ
jgi:hypothetical protein